MSEEKRNVEILNNIKEYMQISIDSGHHKFIYNDLDWDEKCVDIINAIDYFIEKVEQQQKEIEDLKEITQNYNAIGGETFGDDRIIVCSMKYFDDGYFKKNYIFKDKIREKIKAFQNIKKEIIKNDNELLRSSITYDIIRNDYCEKMLQELLEEK